LQVYRLGGTLASIQCRGGRTVMEEDDRPQNVPKPKRDLDPMSIEELNEYIAEMQEEIERVRAEIAKKEAHRAGVDSLFKN
jgi:uncharacterized small protein (DUF1192 family)